MDRKSINRRKFLKISAASGVAALLAACGKLRSTSPTATPEPLLPPATQAPQLWSNWNRGEVARDRMLKIKAFVDGDLIGNPLNEFFMPFGGRGLLLEPCAYYSALADKTILWLVENYQYNKDATELTINFRKNITWSDGVPFTPGDMKFAIDALLRYQDSQDPAFYRKANTLRVAVASVEIINQTSLKIKFTQTDWRFFQRELTFGTNWQGQPSAIVPSHIFQNFSDPELRNYEFFDGKQNFPVVTGPYLQVKCFDSYWYQYDLAPINQFELLPDWWAVKTGLVEKMPEVERVLVINYGKKSDAELLASHDFDLCFDLEAQDMQKLVFETPLINTWTGVKPPYGYLQSATVCLNFNCQQPPFDNPKVRWAVAYAIDQETIVKKLWDNFAPGTDPEAIPNGQPGEFTPKDLIARNPFPPFPAWSKLFGEISDLSAKYDYTAYNPIKSAQLMQEAGFSRDPQGYWIDQNGKRPNASFFISNISIMDFASLAPLIVEQLQQAGFVCDQQTAQDDYVVITTGYAPLFLDWNSASTSDPYETFKDYRKETIVPPGQTSYTNLNRWYNDKFTANIDQIRLTSPDGSKIATLFRQAMEIWYENLPYLPIHYTFRRVAYCEAFWDNWPTAANPYIEPSVETLTIPQWVTNLKAKFREN